MVKTVNFVPVEFWLVEPLFTNLTLVDLFAFLISNNMTS